MEQYVIYLRKSRKDDESEQYGEEETLARHGRLLIELAKRQDLPVTDVRREVESGDSIDARPKMKELLREVEQGLWTGVIVMEVERLARGDTKDQGRVAQAFKYSETLIVTPSKTYDPSNEFDEEYFEFGLFMSRRELKTITRRLQRGRAASVKEGLYTANQPPYGYKRIKLEREKGWTLEPHPEQVDTVKMIFDWYVNGEEQTDGTKKRLGVSLIVRRLNQLKIPPQKGAIWVSASVRDMLINPVYNGMVRWNWRPAKKRMVDGEVTIERPRAKPEECILVKGRHVGIIDSDIFNATQELMKQNPPRPIGERHKVMNPLSGLVICGKCGRMMTRRPYGNKGYPDTLLCQIPECKNVSSHLSLVESRILEALKEWLGEYKLEWNISDNTKQKNSMLDAKRKALQKLEKEIETLNKQTSNLHDLLEQGVYTVDKFLDRSRELGERVEQARSARATIESDLKIEVMREESRKTIIPTVEKLLDVYHELQTPAAKNDMLKEVLEKIVYTKEQGGRWHSSPDNFEITLYPKLPML